MFYFKAIPFLSDNFIIIYDTACIATTLCFDWNTDKNFCMHVGEEEAGM
jgi:hypothetical protein